MKALLMIKISMEQFVSEIAKLKQELAKKDEQIRNLRNELHTNIQPVTDSKAVEWQTQDVEKLTNTEISRYSRQLILPEIGVKGQLSLRNKSVLIVGAGGLGCPAAVYLSAAGIGRLGIVDYDEVELSNLHRQILHTEARVNVCKSVSAASSCKQLNSRVDYVPYHLQLNSSNALDIIQFYDIVLDATDNVATRYLLNDACVLAGKPLVSGSALRFEGQLTVYNHDGGPCYRCLYPKPPPAETVTNCSDGGVLGVIPGIIGSLQALEAIKIAAGLQCILPASYSQKLLMFDGIDGTFRSVRIRGRQPSCPMCGDKRTITSLIDYEQFCGAKASDKDKAIRVLDANERITPKKYKCMLDEGTPHVLVDVRQPVETEICRLPTSSLNVPLAHIQRETTVSDIQSRVTSLTEGRSVETVPVICVCNRGNDSQLAVQRIKEHLKDDKIVVKDIVGGLTAWSRTVDPDFPTY